MDLIDREEVHDIIAMHLSDYMTDETRLKLEMIDCKIEDCIPTVQAIPIEEVLKIIEFEEKWLYQTRMSIRDIDIAINAIKSKIKQIEGSNAE